MCTPVAGFGHLCLGLGTVSRFSYDVELAVGQRILKMYGVPKDLPLQRFVGDTLFQVSIGMDGEHYHFGEAGTISVQGKWQLQDSTGEVVDKWMEHADRDAYRLHEIFNAEVTDFRIDPPQSFSLTFSTGHILTVFDDTSRYEAFHIQPDDIHV